MSMSEDDKEQLRMVMRTTISNFRNELSALHLRRERLEGLIEGMNIAMDKLDAQK